MLPTTLLRPLPVRQISSLSRSRSHSHSRLGAAVAVAVAGAGGSSQSSLRATQRRYARVQHNDVRFVATHDSNSSQNKTGGILERYREKLETKAKEYVLPSKRSMDDGGEADAEDRNRKGLKSVTELKDVYKDKISEYKREASTVRPQTKSADGVSNGLQQPPPPPPTPQSQPQTPVQKDSKTAQGAPGIKSLDSYVDLQKMRELPNKEIEYLWRLRFASDPKSLCAVIPLQTYRRIYQNARSHPQFILPLPRPAAEDGSGDIKESDSGFDADAARTAADIHFLQWGFHPPAGAPPEPNSNTANTHVSTVLFTHLAAFKLHGAYAQPHTTVTHYLDLADSHDIVLLYGSVTDGKGVSVDEARWLLICLQKFYDFEGHGGGIGREKRQGLLEKFSKGDTDFKLEELVDEAERVS